MPQTNYLIVAGVWESSEALYRGLSWLRIMHAKAHGWAQTSLCAFCRSCRMSFVNAISVNVLVLDSAADCRVPTRIQCRRATGQGHDLERNMQAATR